MSYDKEIRLWMYDPGTTTGYAHFQVTENVKLLEWGEFTLWEKLDEQILLGIDRVVFEKVVAPHPAFVSTGIEVIGVIKYLCQRERIPFTVQNPSVITGPKKWYDLSHIRGAHAKDAIWHGLFYFHKNFPQKHIDIF